MSCSYLVAYGITAAQGSCGDDPAAMSPAGLALRYIPVVIFTVICALERYNRHVVKGELFWDFK
jgi:hypothetical protein